MVPISETAEQISLAVTDPEDDFSVKAVEMACGKPATVKLATLNQVERTLDKLYAVKAGLQWKASSKTFMRKTTSTQVDSAERLRDLAAEAPDYPAGEPGYQPGGDVTRVRCPH